MVHDIGFTTNRVFSSFLQCINFFMIALDSLPSLILSRTLSDAEEIWPIFIPSPDFLIQRRKLLNSFLLPPSLLPHLFCSNFIWREPKLYPSTSGKRMAEIPSHDFPPAEKFMVWQAKSCLTAGGCWSRWNQGWFAILFRNRLSDNFSGQQTGILKGNWSSF